MFIATQERVKLPKFVPPLYIPSTYRPLVEVPEELPPMYTSYVPAVSSGEEKTNDR